MVFKLGIVSSYDVLCGNATYSQALLDGLPTDIEAVKIEVPIAVQKYRDSKIEKQILQKVSDCDAVNIQMELGLYGATPIAAAKLIKKIINRSKRVSLTMHRVEERPINLTRSLYNNLKIRKISSFLKEIINFEVSRKYKKIISYAYNNDATFIVHTDREKKRIIANNPDARVIVHPIVWPDDYFQSGNDDVDLSYRDYYSDRTLPVIGLFGFMTDYKNFLQVVRVANELGEYNVLLAGGTHPFSYHYGKRQNVKGAKVSADSAGSLPESLMISEIAMKQEPGKRSVHLVHSPEDEELVKLIRDVDIVCVPYSEVGQSASGIASLAVQFGKQVVFSDTFTSRELSRFLSAPPIMFDTRSDASLASALQIATNKPDSTINFNGYSFSSNIDAYLNSLDIKLDQK